MNKPPEGPLQFFFGTLLQPCPYVPGRLESKVVTELGRTSAAELHNKLALAGYRRTHTLAYKPACPACNACVPVRVPVAAFERSRSLKRVWRRNADLHTSELPPRATAEQFDLFSNYQGSRHADGGMATMKAADYRAMVEETTVDTMMVEFRTESGRLIAASLTDRLDDGLSGVYKFFDPDEARRGVGTYIVLWHIERARILGLAHVYLGYWIADCAKMAYKTRFRPIEALGPDGWRVLDVTDDPSGSPALAGCLDVPSV